MAGPRSEFEPGQIISAMKAGAQRETVMKVQIVPGDGRVVISLLGDRKRAVVTTAEVLRNGGEVRVGGRIGTVVIPGPIVDGGAKLG